ncbi:MAG: hypothetical protein QF434_00620 [Nitrospinaceae bacterium]|nr:hypothetical protein [Nitrospinaceae bacterium]
METILENIIELAEKIWLQLGILLDLENMEALGYFDPLLASILSDPLLLSITAAIILLVPFGVCKLKKAHAEKEKRFDELLHELDETKEEPAPLPTSPQPVAEDREIEPEEPTVVSIPEEAESQPPVAEEEPAVESSPTATQEQEEETILDPGAILEAEKDKEDEGIEFLFEEETKEPEQETVSPLTEVADAPPTQNSYYQEPHEEIESAENLEQELSEHSEESNTAFIEASSEISQEDQKPESVESHVQPAKQVVDTPPKEVEPEPILDSLTAESLQPEPVIAKSSAGPLLKSMLNSSVSAKTDALVSRLKTFQAKLETQFHSLDDDPVAPRKSQMTESVRKEKKQYQPAKVSYRNKRKSRPNKEYVNLLESFIFMAKQKNKNSDL